MISDYDERQLSNMRRQIGRFRNGPVSLDSVYELRLGLRALLACLESMDSRWVEEVRTRGNTLELVYACALADKRADLSENDRKDVDEAVGKLEDLLAAPKEAIA